MIRRITRRSLLRDNRRRLNENRFISGSDDDDYDGYVPYADMKSVPKDFLEKVCRTIAQYYQGEVSSRGRYDALSYRDVKHMMEFFMDEDNTFYEDLVGYVQDYGVEAFVKEHANNLIAEYNQSLPTDERIDLNA